MKNHTTRISLMAILFAATSALCSAQIIGGNSYYGATFSEGLLATEKAYLTPAGKVVFTHGYDAAGSFSEGLAPVAKKTEFEGKKNTGDPLLWEFGKWGFINKTGKLVIPAEWDGCRPFSEGLAAVFRHAARDGKTADKNGVPLTSGGYINTAGKLVIPVQWDKCHSFHEGMAAVERGGKMGFIDKTGKVVIPIEWEIIKYREPRFSEGLAAVTRNGKWGFIDKTGANAIPIEWGNCDNFSEGLAAVGGFGSKDAERKWGFIDRTGKVVIARQWQSCGEFSEGLATVSDSFKHGYIDKTGKLITPIKWDKIQSFRDGLGAVGKDDKWGYIDRSGKLVIPHQWEISMGDVRFSNGFAVVAGGIINKKGNVIPTAEPNPKVSFAPSQFLGKTIEECEKILGKPIASLEPKNGEGKSFRAYKSPLVGVTAIKLRRVPKNGLGATPTTVNFVQYSYPKGSVKTLGEAFSLIGTSMEGASKLSSHDKRKPSADTSIPATITTIGAEVIRIHRVGAGLMAIWQSSASTMREPEELREPDSDVLYFLKE